LLTGFREASISIYYIGAIILKVGDGDKFAVRASEKNWTPPCLLCWQSKQSRAWREFI